MASAASDPAAPRACRRPRLLAPCAVALAGGSSSHATCMRARMQVAWEELPPASATAHGASKRGRRHALGAAGSLAALAIAARGLLAAPRAPDARQAPADISRELGFLARAQNSDGGFGGARGQSSSELYTGWVAMGLAAAGRDPLSLRRGAHTILDALRAQAASLHGAGDLERTILALHACGAS